MPLFFYARSSTGLICNHSKSPVAVLPVLLTVPSRTALVKTEKGKEFQLKWRPIPDQGTIHLLQGQSPRVGADQHPLRG